MTFTLACGDVMPGCAARFEAPDETTLLNAVAAHAREAHDLEATPELVEVVREHVRTR